MNLCAWRSKGVGGRDVKSCWRRGDAEQSWLEGGVRARPCELHEQGAEAGGGTVPRCCWELLTRVGYRRRLKKSEPGD